MHMLRALQNMCNEMKKCWEIIYLDVDVDWRHTSKFCWGRLDYFRAESFILRDSCHCCCVSSDHSVIHVEGRRNFTRKFLRRRSSLLGSVYFGEKKTKDFNSKTGRWNIIKLKVGDLLSHQKSQFKFNSVQCTTTKFFFWVPKTSYHMYIFNTEMSQHISASNLVRLKKN